MPSLIQKCTSINSLKKARQLHSLLITTTTTAFYAQSPFLYNNLLSMYARCGSLGDAKLVFDKMPHRNLVSFNALIAAYSRAPCYASFAFKLNTQMGKESMRPNGLTFTSLLQASCLLEDRVMGSLIHTLVVKFGFGDDVPVQTSLLGMYSNCLDLESAKKVFAYIGDKDVVAWNSMIFGYLKNDKIEEDQFLFDSMVKSGVNPTHFTYSVVLNACSTLGDYSFGQLIHARFIVSNILADLPLQNALLDMYCNCGDTQTAFRIFSKMQNPDLVSWNSMITGYMENGEGEMAMDLFVQLQALSLHHPDEYTFTAIVSATNAFLASDYGKPLHAQVVKAGFESSVFIGTTLVSMYFQNGDSESAKKVFNLISEKDAVLWTKMIMGHSAMTDGEGAIELFCKMCQEGHKSDSFPISGALSACANLAVLNQGKMIHSLAVKMGHDVAITVRGSLIDMYAKNGNLRAAQSIFSNVSNPDLKCWNSMLGGYSHHGMAEEALNVFEEIQKHSLYPDQVTFLSILTACSHSGLVEKGKFLWNHMKENGILPQFKHYSCMVSLLSRAGLLDEAEKVIVESAYSENQVELWRTLLSSCVAQRNLSIGFTAAEQILKFDSGDSATYILLSNLYAASERWDGVAEMRRRIRGLSLEKDPGLSWIENKKNIHVFSSGDQSHPNVDEAQAELHRLKENMIRSVIDEFDSRIYFT
ncbi:PPR domain-containing protein/PPR_2 domain-containing protein [Cephalotus follicularis]|uniref:PPR domain-containing protein/PPR_2 domain-containing protein n=1 Tax=Cephalotus follicularis TaxID=3775 RepID=A0A1Q3D382_CEPFO|nr:PPR domain-containing protein/PPR_2 domain-containing protein [Cephalotus follicularis]